MDGDPRPQGIHLSWQALGQVMPMFLLLNAAGRVIGAGPTLRKLVRQPLIGADFERIFRLRRPREVENIRDLIFAQRLGISLLAAPFTAFKGIAVPFLIEDGVLVNLSFGYAVREAVKDHGLSDTDFAATDLAIELLYLAEAKTAVMSEVTKMAARLQGAKAKAEEEAMTDALTGLGNRRAMELALDGMLAGQRDFALIHLDLDYFKQVNDTLGHAAGDHVLTQVARVLRENVRGGDQVSRVGGDEFVILLPGVGQGAPVERIGRQILTSMQKPILFGGQECKVAVSMGAVLGPSSLYAGHQAEGLMAAADRALYASKRRGRERLTLIGPNGTETEILAGQTRCDAGNGVASRSLGA